MICLPGMAHEHVFRYTPGSRRGIRHSVEARIPPQEFRSVQWYCAFSHRVPCLRTPQETFQDVHHTNLCRGFREGKVQSLLLLSLFLPEYVCPTISYYSVDFI